MRRLPALVLIHGHWVIPSNALTGAGNDVTSSDAFCHWGALRGVVELLERGR